MVNYLEIARRAAWAGGRVVAQAGPVDLFAKQKDDLYVGLHTPVTQADIKSQAAIFDVLRMELAGTRVRVITEEDESLERRFQRLLLKASDISAIQRDGVFTVDSLDGTTGKITNSLYSVAIGYINQQFGFADGAVFAPTEHGYALYYGSKEGSFVKINGKTSSLRVSEKTELAAAFVNFGQDCWLPKYPIHGALMMTLGGMIRTPVQIPSSELALSMVAAGYINATVQPLQAIWDIAAGAPILENAGGTIRFLERVDEKWAPINGLEIRHFNPPSGRNVAYVAAGSKDMADVILETLLDVQEGKIRYPPLRS